MGGCGNCGGDCSHCTGCGAAYVLTEAELDFLRLLGQVAFLPVARRADDLTPIYCGEAQYSPADHSAILQCLEKRNLIDIDFFAPLKGFQGYGDYPLKGSVGLTLQGQQILDMLEIQGISE